MAESSGGGMQYQPTGGGSSMSYGWIGDTINTRRTAQHGTDASIVTKGDGDVSMLKKLLEEMSGSNSAEGMQALFQQIFTKGFEEQMPKLLNAANTTGVRPQDATTQNLLQNDLIARLTGVSAEALQKQQELYGTLAGNYASLTEKPVVTTTEGNGRISGGNTSIGDLFTGMFS